MSASFEVVVVGAGPGGIAAATVAAEAGCRVCLLDDNVAMGGQIWRGFRAENAHKYPHGNGFIAWTTRLQQTKCEVWQGWQAIDQPASGVLRLERAGEIRDVEYGNLIVATGARERFLPFPGWTLPGVMGAGGLQALVKSGLDPQGKRVVLAGSGPLLLAVGAGLASAGAVVAGIYEQAPLSKLAGFALALLAQPAKLAEGARYRLKAMHAPYRTSSWIVQAGGRGRVERVTLTDGRKTWSVDCDWLGCGFNLVPNIELPRLLGCRTVAGYVEVDRLQQSSVSRVACVGELTGIGGLEKALVEGQIAGLSAAGRETDVFRISLTALTAHSLCGQSCGIWREPTPWYAAVKTFPTPSCGVAQVGARPSSTPGAVWARAKAASAVQRRNSCSAGRIKTHVRQFFRPLYLRLQPNYDLLK